MHLNNEVYSRHKQIKISALILNIPGISLTVIINYHYYYYYNISIYLNYGKI